MRTRWDAATRRYSGAPRRWADVYLFARHTARDHLTGCSFYVVPIAVLDATLGSRSTVSLGTLRALGFTPVPG
jgi:hypothetical protein